MIPLHIGGVVRVAYSAVLQYRSNLMRIVMFWLGGCVAATAFANTLVDLIGPTAFEIAMRGYTVVATAVIAIACARLILVGELPRGWTHPRFGGREARYLVVLVAWEISSAAITYGAASFLDSLSGSDWFLPVLICCFPLALGLLWIIGRLGLMLPAIATDLPGFGVRISWERTRGNADRYVIAHIVSAAIFFIPVVAFWEGGTFLVEGRSNWNPSGAEPAIGAFWHVPELIYLPLSVLLTSIIFPILSTSAKRP